MRPFSPSVARWLATWFGVGYIKKGPGTAGSLAALPLAWVLHVWLGGAAVASAALIVFAVGWAASHVYVKSSENSDPGEVVIDEVAGQMLTLSFLAPTLPAYALGFALFRLFDILKPWPVSWADRRIHGGLGIMLDDILAALMAAIVITLAQFAL